MLRRRQTDCGAVHVPWQTKALLGLLTLRLGFALADLHAHFASAKEQPVSRVPCRTFECESLITPDPQHDGFCFSCRAELRRDADALLAEVGHVLDLEAQFVAYCVERGLPHPHD